MMTRIKSRGNNLPWEVFAYYERTDKINKQVAEAEEKLAMIKTGIVRAKIESDMDVPECVFDGKWLVATSGINGDEYGEE